MRGLRLGERERLERDDGGAARQRVRDRLHQAERLRPGQQEGAVAPALAIDRRLQMAEEPGRVLHLVDDHGRRVAREKRAGIALGLFRLARQIERDEAVVGKQPAHQAGLPGLSGAGQYDGRPCRGPLQQERFDLTIDPHRANSTMPSNYSHVLTVSSDGWPSRPRRCSSSSPSWSLRFRCLSLRSSRFSSRSRMFLAVQSRHLPSGPSTFAMQARRWPGGCSPSSVSAGHRPRGWRSPRPPARAPDVRNVPPQCAASGPADATVR